MFFLHAHISINSKYWTSIVKWGLCSQLMASRSTVVCEVAIYLWGKFMLVCFSLLRWYGNCYFMILHKLRSRFHFIERLLSEINELTFFDDSFLFPRPGNLWIVIRDIYSRHMIYIFAAIISICIRWFCEVRLMSKLSRPIMKTCWYWLMLGRTWTGS